MVGVADLNRLAGRIVKQTTDPDTETSLRSSGRTGGLKGGKARAAKLSAEERSPRVHRTLGDTPAMAGGVSDHKWTLTEIAARLD